MERSLGGDFVDRLEAERDYRRGFLDKCAELAKQAGKEKVVKAIGEGAKALGPWYKRFPWLNALFTGSMFAPMFMGGGERAGNVYNQFMTRGADDLGAAARAVRQPATTINYNVTQAPQARAAMPYAGEYAGGAPAAYGPEIYNPAYARMLDPNKVSPVRNVEFTDYIGR